MPLDVQWRTSPRATILHAVRLLADDVPVIDHSIVAILKSCSQTLREMKLGQQFWAQLLPIASANADLSLLVDQAIARSQTDRSAADVARLLVTAEQQVVRSGLDVAEELRLRQGPLRELWEASGPGMLLQIGRRTKRSIASHVDLDSLLPLYGGFGQAFAGFDRIQIELVLTNPSADVPEVVRLAWLIAQLSIPGNSNAVVQQLALVPCCLATAEGLGLAQCQPASLANALRSWRLGHQHEEALADLLLRWWNECDPDAAWSQSVQQLRDTLATSPNLTDIAKPKR